MKLVKMVCGVSVLSLLPVCLQVYASDFEIYTPATAGQKTAMIVLDTSGSMGSNGWYYKDNNAYADSIWEDYRDNTAVLGTANSFKGGPLSPWTGTSITPYTSSPCKNLADWSAYGITGPTGHNSAKPVLPATTIDSRTLKIPNYTGTATMPSFKRTYCAGVAKDDSGNIIKNYTGSDALIDQSTRLAITDVNGNALKAYYDRLTRLKDGIYTFLESTYDDKKGTYTKNYDVYVGLSQFSTAFNAAGALLPQADGVSGSIVVPAKKLDDTQRIAIATMVSKMLALNGTPTAPAYTEAAAYLLGKKTSGTGSGFANSRSTPSDMNTKNGTTNYISPLNLSATTAQKQCSGQGIYILTDGFPNSTTTADARALMRTVAGASFACGSSLSGAADSGWGCMGSFAQWLNSPANNIKTATVGFGALFNGVRKTDTETCIGTVTDGINLCKLGGATKLKLKPEPNPDKETEWDINQTFGGGGAFAADDALGVTTSLTTFIDNIGKASFTPLPTGSITIPRDGFDSARTLPFAYMQLLQPAANANATVTGLWDGNVKKYSVANQMYRDKHDNAVFNDNYGTLNEFTKDLWTLDSMPFNGQKIDLGGAIDKLPLPTRVSGTTLAVTRKLFTDRGVTSGLGYSLEPIPNATAADAQTAVYNFIKNPTGKLNGLSPTQLIYIANYLGYNLATTDYSTLTNGNGSSATDLKSYLSNAPLKLMGGVVHSTPVYLSYSAQLDDNYQLLYGSTNRDDKIMFGSLEGGLHVVDAKTGDEQFVFLPDQFIQNPAQIAALKKGTTGSFVHGVDAPWVVDSELEYSPYLVTAKSLYVYGGLRMGGVGFYGLDLTSLTSPKLLFKITNTGDYARLGQTWAKPTIAKIRSKKDGLTRKVILLAGGYGADTNGVLCYEDPAVNCSGRVTGNAVYIIDAITGERLSTISSDTATATKVESTMTHSVVSEITAVDRDSDGLVDHLYYADLGGQVFRADIDNGSQFVGSTKPLVKFVARIADLGKDLGAAAYRFYTAPVYTHLIINNTDRVMINVASGNRSNPLNYFASGGQENAVFALLDDGVIKTNIFDPKNATPPNDSNAPILLTDLKEDPSSAAFVSGKKGWYKTFKNSPLTGSTASSQKGALKSFESPVRLASSLFVPIFDPTYIKPDPNIVGAPSPCNGGVKGATFLRQYCLPYGYCTSSSGSSSSGIEVDTIMGQGIGGVSVTGNKKDPACETKGNCPVDPDCEANGTCPLQVVVPNNDNGAPIVDHSPQVNFYYLRWFKKIPNSARIY